MKRFVLAILAVAVVACSPPQNTSGAEALVRDIYATVEEHIGRTTTPLEAIPMTDDLASLVSRAQAAAAARNEPFIEGDIAANCQDCTSLDGLEVGPQVSPEPVPAAEGHVLVEARFTLNGNEPRAVLYDLVETPQGWRVDNILTEGFNLRTEAQSYLDDAAEPAEEIPAP
ncbi:hypothetical protein [Vitreimonas sp.]|uniref:hypothetical protein n=1 Tax=Vitreimonas sp. TaxID=3069702 RepID=UPI002EDA5E72